MLTSMSNLASYADVLRLVTREECVTSLRTSAWEAMSNPISSKGPKVEQAGGVLNEKPEDARPLT